MEQQLTPFFWPPFFPPLKLWLHVILYLKDSPAGCDQHRFAATYTQYLCRQVKSAVTHCVPALTMLILVS